MSAATLKQEAISSDRPLQLPCYLSCQRIWAVPRAVGRSLPSALPVSLSISPRWASLTSGIAFSIRLTEFSLSRFGTPFLPVLVFQNKAFALPASPWAFVMRCEIAVFTGLTEDWVEHWREGRKPFPWVRAFGVEVLSLWPAFPLWIHQPHPCSPILWMDLFI